MSWSSSPDSLTPQTMFRSLLLPLLLAIAAHGGDGSKDSSSSTQHLDIHSKSLILAKIWCLILVWVGTFIGGVSPYLLKWNDVFLLLGTHFAAGLFLATVMMGFPMDAIETFGDLTEKKSSFSFMLPIVGCLLAIFAGYAISYVYGKEEEQSGRSSGDLEVSRTIVQGKGSNANGMTHYHNASVDVRSPRDSILLIMALCFHSILEGIAIGAAETEADAWRALWTISPHSMLAAIGMGTILLRMMPSRPLLSCVAYAFAFAISSPSGMAIGIIVDPAPQCEVAGLIFANSMGLAHGMLTYVSLSQMLSKRSVSQSAVSVDTPIHKLSAMTLGCGVIAALMIWDAFGCSPAVFLLGRVRSKLYGWGSRYLISVK